ncbi:MAG: 16S rRNA (guanine(527)-N(7))-methyltransferase RsmG [Sandaracinobacteroides sp.]
MFHVEHMTRSDFESAFDVPRGTMQRLDRYAEMLADWQLRMNIVGASTLADVWRRHFADSAQLTRLVPRNLSWLDIGAGGGFPGLVIAAMGWGRFTLVESVAKKCRFLEAVRDDLDLQDSTHVFCGRVEEMPSVGADVITARAAAPLLTLFDWGHRHSSAGGSFVFPKGRRWKEEVATAMVRFSFDLETFPSMTDPDARILIARNLKRR